MAFSAIMTESFAAAGLNVGEQTSSRGSIVAIDVLMQSDSNVAALQFDLVFDNSRLSVQSPSLAPSQSTHLLDSEIIAPGRLRVAVFSPLSSPLSNGRLATIPFKVGSNVNPGELHLVLEANEVILSTPAGRSIDDPALNNGAILVEPGQGVVRIGGRIRYFGGSREALSGVRLRLIGDDIAELTSDDAGSYEFDALGGVDYVLNAAMLDSGATRVGVDVLDLFQIRKHIELIDNLENPLGVLAGDVDRSRTLDLVDLEMIRGVILGRQDRFIDSNGNAQAGFEFVSSDIRFSDPRDPWLQLAGANRIGQRSISDVTSNRFNQDFSGLRLGDVNGDWVNSKSDEDLLLIRDRLGSAVELQVDSEFATRNEIVRVPISARGLGDLVAFQFAVRWNPEVLDFDGIETDQLLGFNAEEQSHLVEPGHLVVVWDDPEALGVSEAAMAPLLSLRFRGVGDVGDTTLISVEDGAVEPIILGASVRSRPGLVPGIVVLLESESIPSNRSTGRTMLFDYGIDGTTRLWASGIDGERYMLEAANRVDEPIWELIDEQTADGSIISFTDSNNSELQQRYYRIIRIAEEGSR